MGNGSGTGGRCTLRNGGSWDIGSTNRWEMAEIMKVFRFFADISSAIFSSSNFKSPCVMLQATKARFTLVTSTGQRKPVNLLGECMCSRTKQSCFVSVVSDIANNRFC